MAFARCFIPPEYYLNPKEGATELWRKELLPMGLKLFEMAFKDILNGVIKRSPQDECFSTFEPDTNVKDIYKPDLLMLEQFAGESTQDVSDINVANIKKPRLKRRGFGVFEYLCSGDEIPKKCTFHFEFWYIWFCGL
ncbi:hypothetical protein ACILD6_06630 [Capnocytophaga canimorsus]|uniref:hypothetical protein n=1 Tax=Capnocytophaga canimorsus TaxID=28188 RepID=UPI0037D55C1E